MRVNSSAIGLSVAFVFCIIFLLMQSVVGDDWSLSCASNCTCKWTNGKKSAICSSLQLTAIPTTLSTELQVLVLNNNHIPYLNREEFANLELLNLQRIYLKKSEVQYVHKEAFKDLKILVEIDLSDNRLEMLDKDTFMGNDRLRILYLNGNPLKKLVAYQFPILPHLRTLDLHDCLLSYIDPMALANLNMLEFLYLKNNLLESLSEYVFQHMASLKTLVLDENPWQCNCKLRKFRSWYVNSKLYSESLLCKGPPQHKDLTWDSVQEELFGCSPKVEIFNNEDLQNIEIGSNATFSCLVYGDPLPEIYWELNGKILDSDNVMFEAETIASDKTWSNLTVFNMTSLDAGTYVCSGTNVVGVGSQNISIYLTEIVQHVLVKTPETFWYFGLIMGTFGTVFLLILISFVVCLCKRTTRKRRHPSKMGVKPSVSFNDQEKKLLDLSITTTTNDRVDSCLDNNHSTATAMSKVESVMGFEPIEIHSSDNHKSTVHGHHALMMGAHHQMTHQQQIQHNHSHMPPNNNAGSLVSNHAQQLLAVSDGSCSVVGIPTSMASAVTSDGHTSHIAEEFPLNVGVFPPPPEFCSNIVANPTYGNIFISVSVTQDMLDGADISMYPDLLNIPKRIQDNGLSSVVVTQTTSNSNQLNSHGIDTMSPPQSQSQQQQQHLPSSIIDNQSSININSFATLPRNNQRRGILKKDSSLQHQQQPQLPQSSLYTHDEIVSYHNLETTYSQGYQEHQTELIGLPPPPPPPTVKCHHAQHPSNAATKTCSVCMSTALEALPANSSPVNDITPLRPLYKSQNGSVTLKYDNMGRRITASGNSTLSLPDEERLESETLFNDGNPLTKTPASKITTKLQQDCQSLSPTAKSAATLINKNIGGEFVSL